MVYFHLQFQKIANERIAFAQSAEIGLASEDLWQCISCRIYTFRRSSQHILIEIIAFLIFKTICQNGNATVQKVGEYCKIFGNATAAKFMLSEFLANTFALK
jgi:hypothetical protein